jgi:membrane associated rhomboid family serine protease
MSTRSRTFTPVIVLVAIIWLVEIFNLVLSHRLSHYGIAPRTMTGLIGIPLAPLLHGSLTHAISNTVPMLVLGALITLHGQRMFITLTVLVALFSGLGIWVIGRSAVHVGASSLVYGYIGFLSVYAFYRRDLKSIVIAVVTLALFSGALWGV